MILVASFASIVLFFVLAGTLYQILGSRRDVRRYSGQGRWIDVNHGCRLYAYELGEGEPTVVFESGIGATHLNWRHIQEQVAQVAGTVSYDRAGLGWSSSCRTPRTPANVAAELRQMLARADAKPPFVLVGHSFGGLVMRRFALLYPEDVVGVLLIDPMRCEEWPPLNPGKQSQLDLGQKLIGYAVPMTRCGLVRLTVTLLVGRAGKISSQLAGAALPDGRNVLTRITTEVRKMPRSVWPAVAAHWSRPSFYVGMRSHLKAIPETVREMHVAEPIRAIPVTVLTPAKAVPLNQDQLDHIGENARQVIAPDSAHWIHLDQPALVIDSIRTMVDATSPATMV